MSNVSFQRVVQEAMDASGDVSGKIASATFTSWRRWVESNLRSAWRLVAWPDVCPVEQRWLRDWYSDTTAYEIGDEFFNPDDGIYYNVIKAATGVDAPDETRYAESKQSYSADDYDDTLAYAVGDQVFYPRTQLSYQAHTAGTGNLPTDPAFWGPLRPFRNFLDHEQTGKTIIGEVLRVTPEDPQIRPNSRRIQFRAAGDSTLLLENRISYWVKFRKPVPRFTGDKFNAANTYAVDDQIYFEGDFYDCIVATAAGESPTTTPASWRLVAIPELFRRYLAQACFADWLVSDGQVDKADAARKSAQNALELEADVLFRQQGQGQPAEVFVR